MVDSEGEKGEGPTNHLSPPTTPQLDSGHEGPISTPDQAHQAFQGMPEASKQMAPSGCIRIFDQILYDSSPWIKARESEAYVVPVAYEKLPMIVYESLSRRGFRAYYNAPLIQGCTLENWVVELDMEFDTDSESDADSDSDSNSDSDIPSLHVELVGFITFDIEMSGEDSVEMGSYWGYMYILQDEEGRYWQEDWCENQKMIGSAEELAERVGEGIRWRREPE